MAHGQAPFLSTNHLVNEHDKHSQHAKPYGNCEIVDTQA
jgi:hypothetical protein